MESKNKTAELESFSDSDSVKFTDVLFILLKKKKLAFSIILSMMVATFLISWLQDKWYESTAIVLPPDKPASALDALASGLGGIGSGLLGIGNEAGERYIAILGSRRLREEVIKKFDLMNEFGHEYIEDTLDELGKLLSIEADKKSGTITITMEFRNNPALTAEIVNHIVRRLDEINRELSTEQARSNRRFIEGRYLKAGQELQQAEDSLNLFQNRFGVIEITEQTAASIKASAEISAEIAATEVELNVKKRTLGETHAEILKVQAKLDELRAVQNKLENGGRMSGIFIPFKRTPDLALEYYRLFRQVQICSKIVEFLIPQYEQAKIQEAKDTPTLLVLDYAHAASKHTRPRKVINTLIAGLLTSLALFVGVFTLERIKSNEQLLSNEKFIYITKSLRIQFLLRE